MRVHFIGICGVSMHALADLCARRGYEVTGSDLLLDGHAPENVHGADLVVYTAAAQENCELIEARRLHIPVLSRAQLLAAVENGFDTTVAVGGCHGKTTTVGFLGAATAGLKPEVHIGGAVDYPTAGADGLFVTEACEFKRSFLELRPDIAAVLNVDLDHTDCYADIGAAYEAFFTFASYARRYAVVNGDDEYLRAAPLKNKITFGLGDCDYRAECVSFSGGTANFFVCHGDKHVPMHLNLCGKHNVYNALCAVTCAHLVGVPLETAVSDASTFRGVKRRFEKLGKVCGADVYTDYAHHPREIAATLTAARNLGYARVTVVFEPHTYSRTASLADAFAEALAHADEVILAPVYAARETPIANVSSGNVWLALRKRGKTAVCLDTYCAVNAYVSGLLRPHDAVIYMGAGSIDCAAHQLCSFDQTQIGATLRP